MIDDRDYNYTVSENQATGLRLPEYAIRRLIGYGLTQIRKHVDDINNNLIDQLFARIPVEARVQLKTWIRNTSNIPVGVNWPRDDQSLPFVTVVNSSTTDSEQMALLGDYGGINTLGTYQSRDVRRFTDSNISVIYVATDDPSLTNYLSMLVRYIVLSNKDELTKWHDIHNLSVSMQDVQYNEQFLPSFCYIRAVQLSYITFYDFYGEINNANIVSLDLAVQTVDADGNEMITHPYSLQEYGLSSTPSSSSPSIPPSTPPVGFGIMFTGDPTGILNSRDALRDALAEAWSLRQSTGRRQAIYIPPGRYKITDKDGLRAISVLAMNGITFIGEPGLSVLSFEGDAGLGDWYLFQVWGGSYDIEFRSLVFEMGVITNPDPSEQNHLIQIGSNATKIKVVDCIFKNTLGDGIRMLGDWGVQVRDIEITGCTFENCGRAGVSFQRWVRDVRLTDFTMTGGTDQQIDFEPTGYGLTSDAGGDATTLIDVSASFVTWGIEVGDLIVNTDLSVMCTVTAVTATTLTISAGASTWALSAYYFPKHCSGHLIADGKLRRDGTTGADILITLTGTYGCTLRNVILDGCIQGVDVLYGAIEDCTLLTRRTGSNTSAINLIKGCSGTSIRRNKLWLRNTTDIIGRSGINIAHQIRVPDEIIIEGNEIYQQVRGVSISAESAGRTRIRYNALTLYTPSDSLNQSGAITLRATTTDIIFAQIVGNDIRIAASGGQWSYGIQIAANPNDVHSCEVGGGSISNCLNPLVFSASGGGVFTSPPIIQPMNVQTGASPLVPSATVKWFQLSGVSGQAAGGTYMPRHFWGDDTPEGVLTAPVGSIAQRRNGGAGTTLYVKETGIGNTGWVAK